MKYMNAKEILPKELIRQIQKYTNGNYLYIPKSEKSHKKWGELSGTKEALYLRNKEIKELFKSGSKMTDIANKYYLSESTVKKIIYS